MLKRLLLVSASVEIADDRLRVVILEHAAVEKRVGIPRHTLNAAQRLGAMICGARFSMPRAIASPARSSLD